MPNALHSQNYQIFREMLVNERLKIGLTQLQVAGAINKPQSYVSKYERGERRLDFAEFVEIALFLELDTNHFVKEYMKKLG